MKPSDEARYVEAYENLGVRIREAHAVLKDLRYVRRELQEAHRALEESVRNAVNMIAEATEKALEEVMPGYMTQLRTAVDKACEVATEKVYKRFNTLADIMMGEEKNDKETLAQLLRRWRAAHHG